MRKVSLAPASPDAAGHQQAISPGRRGYLTADYGGPYPQVKPCESPNGTDHRRGGNHRPRLPRRAVAALNVLTGAHVGWADSKV